MPKTVLVPLLEGFEELEVVAPVDILRRAGVEVHLAAVDEAQMAVKGRNGMVLTADSTMTAQVHRAHDLLLVPGGPAVKALRSDAKVRAAVQQQAVTGGHLAAICAGPLVLLDAGVLPERYCAHFSTKDELANALDERVVVDGRVVTSQGAGTAVEFGLALVELLVSADEAAAVAKAIVA